MQGNGTYDVVLWNNSDAIFQFNPSNVLNANQWYLLGFSVTGTSVKVYINGQVVMAGSITGSLKT